MDLPDVRDFSLARVSLMRRGSSTSARLASTPTDR